LFSKFHDIAEILLKLALNTNQSINQSFVCIEANYKVHYQFYFNSIIEV
jgi:hypothetical protein